MAMDSYRVVECFNIFETQIICMIIGTMSRKRTPKIDKF